VGEREERRKVEKYEVTTNRMWSAEPVYKDHSKDQLLVVSVDRWSSRRGESTGLG
jgi:hypothetical protein